MYEVLLKTKQQKKKKKGLYTHLKLSEIYYNCAENSECREA